MLALKLINDPDNDDLTYNFNDSLTTFLSICSVTDTVQGVVILNLIAYTFGYLDDMIKTMGPGGAISTVHTIIYALQWVFILADWWSILPDLVDMS